VKRRRFIKVFNLYWASPVNLATPLKGLGHFCVPFQDSGQARRERHRAQVREMSVAADKLLILPILSADKNKITAPSLAKIGNPGPPLKQLTGTSRTFFRYGLHIRTVVALRHFIRGPLRVISSLRRHRRRIRASVQGHLTDAVTLLLSSQ
jgi:hypothetical protein